jgi:hypothetical protein
MSVRAKASSPAASPLLAQRPAHEAPRILGTREHDLRQHRLVELDERGARRQQEVDLLAKHADDILGEVLTRPADAVGNALYPHDPRQKVQPGSAIFTGLSVSGPDTLQLVDGQRSAPPDRLEDGRMPRRRRHVERFELRRELFGIVDQGEQVREGMS